MILLPVKADTLNVEQKPKNFSECLTVEGPCVFISCRHHFIWANRNKFKLEDDKIIYYLQTLNQQTACTLMFVYWHRTGARLREIGEVFGFSRERVRQIERDATKRLMKKVNNLSKKEMDFFKELLPEIQGKTFSERNPISQKKVVSFYKSRQRSRGNTYKDSPLTEARINLA